MGSKEKNDAYAQLRRQLSAKDLGRLYLFYGEEDYLKRHALAQAKKILVPKGQEAFCFHELSGENLTIEFLENLANTIPLFGARLLVFVEDYDLYKADAATRERLCALLSDLPDFICLIFSYFRIEYKPDARTKLHSVLKEHALAVSFPYQNTGDLVRWISRRFHAISHEIDAETAKYLLFLCGDSMTNLARETEKIGAFAEHSLITKNDIDAVAVKQTEASVFQMTDAIVDGTPEKALALLGELLHMREPPIMLLAMMGRQMRQLYSARLLLERGQNERDFMELWSMRSSYPAQRLLRAARRVSLDYCRQAVILCAQTDLKLKHTGADGADAVLELLLALCAGEAYLLFGSQKL